MKRITRKEFMGGMAATVALGWRGTFAAPARRQRNYDDMTWWDPYVEDIADADTYLRRKFRQDVTDKATGVGVEALKFYASCRLQVQRIGAIKSVAGEVIGNRTRVKVVKNKVASPFTEAEFDILYSCGISWEGSVLDAALARGVVERRGSLLSFGGEQIAQGSLAAIAYLRENPDLAAKIVELVKTTPPDPAKAKAARKAA